MTLESDEIVPIPEQEPLRSVTDPEPLQIEDSETQAPSDDGAEDPSDIQQIIDGLDEEAPSADDVEEPTASEGEDSENAEQSVSDDEAVTPDSIETAGEAASVSDVPERLEAEGAVTAGADEDRRGHVPAWPFVVYDLVWVAFAGLLVWQFAALPPGMAPFESDLYAAAMLVGVGLTVLGLVVIVAVWLYSRSRYGGEGLFVSSLTRGAVATIAGVALWWTALIVVDYVRLGSFF